MSTGPEALSVPVEGGALACDRYGAAAAVPVIAAHGISSHRHAWRRVADRLPDLELVAVDLRGRGGSRELPGPSSIGRHVGDLLRVADALGADRVVAAGHSMGAAVALACAVEHPDRVAGVVLVDGGLPLRPAGSGGGDGAPDLSLVLARLSMTFESVEAYREHWRAHPAMGPYWDAAVEHYVDSDLVGEPPQLRPGAHPDRVAEDLEDLVAGYMTTTAVLDRLERPALALRAERGLLDQPEGLYPRGWPQELAADRPLLEVREVADVNHYTILLDDRGASAVARAIRDILP